MRLLQFWMITCVEQEEDQMKGGAEITHIPPSYGEQTGGGQGGGRRGGGGGIEFCVVERKGGGEKVWGKGGGDTRRGVKEGESESGLFNSQLERRRGEGEKRNYLSMCVCVVCMRVYKCMWVCVRVPVMGATVSKVHSKRRKAVVHRRKKKRKVCECCFCGCWCLLFSAEM